MLSYLTYRKTEKWLSSKEWKYVPSKINPSYAEKFNPNPNLTVRIVLPPGPSWLGY
jgi:hypothetical protein